MAGVGTRMAGRHKGLFILSASLFAFVGLILVLAWARRDSNVRTVRRTDRERGVRSPSTNESSSAAVVMPASPRDKDTEKAKSKEVRDQVAAEKRRIQEKNVDSLVDALKKCALSDDSSPKGPLITTLSRTKDLSRPAVEEALRKENDPKVLAFLQEALNALNQ